MNQGKLVFAQLMQHVPLSRAPAVFRATNVVRPPAVQRMASSAGVFHTTDVIVSAL